jgi:hypothetical protein
MEACNLAASVRERAPPPLPPARLAAFSVRVPPMPRACRPGAVARALKKDAAQSQTNSLTRPRRIIYNN